MDDGDGELMEAADTHRYDVLIVGSGIAGLSFACKVAEMGHKVCILTKKDRAESNTNYAQGGIAAVTDAGDDIELHVQDTLICGDGLCDEPVVRAIIGEAPAQIAELVRRGVEFSQLEDGRVSLHQEGGHSRRRILHVKDLTGKAIEDALLNAVDCNPNITLLEHMHAIDLITNRKLAFKGYRVDVAPPRVLGLYAYNGRCDRVETFAASAVMLCTGGVGQVYLYTTNPSIATGDGIAMAFRAGAEIRNMEFIQFHPTALYAANEDRFLISEAVRGEGAVLRNLDGDAFMASYDPRADLAPRDIVARAIDTEMKSSGARHVWLDITHRPAGFLQQKFPHIYAHCKAMGIDMAVDPIPVVPAMHYLCGGVQTGLDGATDLCGLYACGETACTGLHGANRLASNSLLEAVVMAHYSAQAVDQFLRSRDFPRFDLPEWIVGDARDSDERVVLFHNWDELRRTMWDYVGIVRTQKRLERAKTRILNLKREIEDYYWNAKVEPRLLELRNLIDVAEIIVTCAQRRHESRGLHHTLDHPHKLPTPIHSSWAVRR